MAAGATTRTINTHHLAAFLFFFALASTAGGAPVRTVFKDRVKDLVPEVGCWVGAAIDYTAWNFSLTNYSRAAGFLPASWIVFVELPLRPADVSKLEALLGSIAGLNGFAIVTAEPMLGLGPQNLPDSAVLELADIIRKYEYSGLKAIIRFAHEMNGSWYAWCQQPTLYKEDFRRVAWLLRNNTLSATMLWAVNEGGGYPFTGGYWAINCSDPARSIDCFLLDTDGDGVITQYDDMYSPFYPGDDVVDWVGLSVYHFGESYPYGNNHIPEPRKFGNKLLGEFNGRQGDERNVPSFYGIFSKERNKPMIVAETGAWFNLCDRFPDKTNCSRREELGWKDELSIKSAWWRQVFALNGDTDEALDISVHFPNLKIINWFDIRKPEAEASMNTVDWSTTGSDNPDVHQQYLQILKVGLYDAETNSTIQYWRGAPRTPPPIDLRTWAWMPALVVPLALLVALGVSLVQRRNQRRQALEEARARAAAAGLNAGYQSSPV